MDDDEDGTYLTSRNCPVAISKRKPIIGTSLRKCGELLSAWISLRILASTSPGDQAQAITTSAYTFDIICGFMLAYCGAGLQ